MKKQSKSKPWASHDTLALFSYSTNRLFSLAFFFSGDDCEVNVIDFVEKMISYVGSVIFFVESEIFSVVVYVNVTLIFFENHSCERNYSLIIGKKMIHELKQFLITIRALIKPAKISSRLLSNTIK